MLLPLAILALVSLAVVAPPLARWWPRAGGVALAIPVAAIAAALWWAGRGGAVPASSTPWLPELGMALSFRMDGLSLMFALLVTGLGALIVVYAWSYLDHEAHRGRAMALLLAFAGSMLGVVLADDLVLLYVFWELTSLTSWLLIAFHHERREARYASWQALLVTVGGGLALLAGVLLLALAAGTSRISEVVAAAPRLAAHPHLPWAAALVVAGIATKSAQFPFQGWLPKAMEAPTPISAYLHAATMVKAGVYLALRMAPVLGAVAVFRWGLVVLGGISFLLGAARAVLESDLKRVLAFSTVSALGLLLLLTGTGTTGAIHAALAYTLAHALYKGALFLTAGSVDHGAGTRDTDRLSGLRRAQPLTAAAAALAGLSMAGVPGGFGYVAKEAAYGSLLSADRLALLGVAVAGSALFVVVAAIAGWLPFWRRPSEAAAAAHEVGPALWVPPLAIAAAGLVYGTFPRVADALLAPAATELVAGEAVPLGLWHGWDTAALSAATLLLGAALLRVRARVRASAPAAVRGGVDGFPPFLRGLDRVARAHTAIVQGTSLRRNLAVTFGVAAALLAAGFVRGSIRLHWPEAMPRAPELALGAIAMIAAVAAVRSRSRLTAIAALGGVGYAVGLLFLLFGAPDLAMTQIAVETVTLVVLLLAFRHLPRFSQISSASARARDVGIAAAVGLLMAGLVLATTRAPAPAESRISAWHLEHSAAEAHGRNVVNTILVDFRGLDTLGEITVLAIAGFGIVALLRLRPRRDE